MPARCVHAREVRECLARACSSVETSPDVADRMLSRAAALADGWLAHRLSRFNRSPAGHACARLRAALPLQPQLHDFSLLRPLGRGAYGGGACFKLAPCSAAALAPRELDLASCAMPGY